LDNDYRVVDLNPAAWQLTSLEPDSSIGRNIETLLPVWPEFLASCRDNKTLQQEIPGRENILQCLDMHIIPLNDWRGHQRGKLITLRDITARKQLEAEREELIHTLQDALVRVKTLSGLLPICANCKKIRDDQGYWHQVEVYIHEHSEADFSHGICPECGMKLYPQLYENTGHGK
jgi:hypothetical protein